MRLVSWIGNPDIEAATGAKVGLGPIVATVSGQAFTSLNVLFNYPKSRVDEYLVWLGQHSTAAINSQYAQLNSPIDFHEIYLGADALLADLLRVSDESIAILLSPDRIPTSPILNCWINLKKVKIQ